MKISAAFPPGVAALLFAAARARRALEEQFLTELELAGYGEVILPILDYLEPYEPFLTASARKELYQLIDRDGALLALRADFTPMLARLLAPRLPLLPRPLRLFYRGDVVRYQGERPGHAREFYQLGAELLGVPGEVGEDEILRLFLRLLSHGAGDRSAVVVLGFAGAFDRFLRQAADPAALAAAIFRRERGGAVTAFPGLQDVVAHGVPADPETLGPEAAERLQRLQTMVRALRREFPAVQLVIDLAEFAREAIDPDVATGLGERAYYDGVVFRGFVGGLGLPVGAGGRYDRLFGRLGAELPAVGFSLGLDRLLAGSPEEVAP